MKVIRDPREAWPLLDGTLGFVPTMGALHEGHLHLMRTAGLECDHVAASIFVNPTQFGAGEDFERYPRDEDADFAMAESAGVSWMFAPTAEAMYAHRTTSIRVADVSERWEGASRPGHFDGVATVVAKLFHIVRPNVAFFGEKDFQQCAVIRRMVEDLDFRLSLRFVETVREPDGLALSSRNRYLSESDRRTAPSLYAALQSASQALAKMDSWNEVRAEQVISDARASLADKGFSVEYLAVVRADDLAPFDGVGDARVIAAARLGVTRLIDNTGVPMHA